MDYENVVYIQNVGYYSSVKKYKMKATDKSTQLENIIKHEGTQTQEFHISSLNLWILPSNL